MPECDLSLSLSLFLSSLSQSLSSSNCYTHNFFLDQLLVKISPPNYCTKDDQIVTVRSSSENESLTKHRFFREMTRQIRFIISDGFLFTERENVNGAKANCEWKRM